MIINLFRVILVTFIFVTAWYFVPNNSGQNTLNEAKEYVAGEILTLKEIEDNVFQFQTEMTYGKITVDGKSFIIIEHERTNVDQEIVSINK